MAQDTTQPTGQMTDAQRKGIAQDFNVRLADARQFKSDIRPDLSEGYFFTRPRRARDVMSSNIKVRRPVPKDVDSLMTTLGIECSEDFAGFIMNTFMPANVSWCKRGRGAIPLAQWNDIAPQVDEADNAIMATMRSSNLDSALYMAYDPDLSIGTAAIWIDDDKIWKTPAAKVVPIRKLEINIDANGDIDDRFVVDGVFGSKLNAILPGVKLPDKLQAKVSKSPKEVFAVVRGFWRNWQKPNDDIWCYTIMVDDQVVFYEELKSKAQMPLIVTRFKPDPDQPWGNGPAIESLPYMRVLDMLSGAQQDRADLAIAPPFAYPNDGVINFEDGIRHGMAYPMAPGSGRDFQELFFKGDVNLGMFTIEALEKSIRRKWYVDMPQQSGKTPPTLGQWLDQVAQVQKRVGLVGQRFWAEGPMEYFKRFKFLLEARGLVQKIDTGNGNSLEPYNPAIKSQEWEAVQKASQLLSISKSALGLDGQAAIDGLKTIRNLKQKMGDELVAIRSDAEMKAAIEQMMPQASFNVNSNDITRGAPGQAQ